MKKPAKPKPKRRARPGPPRQDGRRPAPAAASSLYALAAPASHQGSKATFSQTARRNGIVGDSGRDDRIAFTLLLMPFLIVAFALGLAQTRRANLPALPEITIRAPAPVDRIAIAPPFAAPVPQPRPAPVAPPPSAPPVAKMDATPAPLPAAPRPNDIAIPGPVPRFPPPVPLIELAAPVTAAPPARIPEVTVAALDVRPPTPMPVPPPVEASPSPAEGLCAPTPEKLASFSLAGRLARVPRKPRAVGLDADTFGRRLSAAALAQTDDLVIYTARYQAMAYPMGDVLALHGACIDVVIRAFREVGIDLQEEIQRARRARGDADIDHRRTENMRRFLEKHGTSLPITHFPENYKPGDIVTYHRPFSRISTSHIAIVSDVLAATGRPMIVHNRGYGPQLEDALFVDKITGHYRYMGQAAPARSAGKPSVEPKAAPVVRASFPQR